MISNLLKKCGCGKCNEMIPCFDNHGRPRRFAKGHWGSLKEKWQDPEFRKKQILAVRKGHKLIFNNNEI